MALPLTECPTSLPVPGMASIQQIIPQRALYSVAEAKQLLGGISHSWFYDLVKIGEIHLVKLGRRSFVNADEIRRIAEG